MHNLPPDLFVFYLNLGSFLAQMGYLKVNIMLKNCFWVYTYNFLSFLYFWLAIWINFGVILPFLGVLIGYFFCPGYVSKSILGFILKAKKLLFSVLPSMIIFFYWYISWVVLGFFGPNGLNWEYCMGFYSCSWTIFIFYVSFNSYFWFWPNTHIFYRRFP